MCLYVDRVGAHVYNIILTARQENESEVEQKETLYKSAVLLVASVQINTSYHIPQEDTHIHAHMHIHGTHTHNHIGIGLRCHRNRER